MVRSVASASRINHLSDPKTAAIMGYKFKTRELAALGVADMRDVLFGTNSTARPDLLLRGLLKRPPCELWPLFHEFWSMCDNTWRWRKQFIATLKRNGDARPYMDHKQITFFETLPNEVRVFRGCSRSRIDAMSWTTDLALAQGFAAGHRKISVPDAVVASALIAREDIMTVIVDRDENEVVLDAQQLGQVEVQSFQIDRGATANDVWAE